ncbi:unnamed protein product [Mycena citricolor]|uniref:Uncharacterized protein n=1 Tax=Mycena citricolor TaxID=2018698 RepID=A0AAD2H8D6_9AGAR|nr:unnamed protein product [Mycena citricolor]
MRSPNRARRVLALLWVRGAAQSRARDACLIRGAWFRAVDEEGGAAWLARSAHGTRHRFFAAMLVLGAQPSHVRAVVAGARSRVACSWTLGPDDPADSRQR